MTGQIRGWVEERDAPWLLPSAFALAASLLAGALLASGRAPSAVAPFEPAPIEAEIFAAEPKQTHLVDRSLLKAVSRRAPSPVPAVRPIARPMPPGAPPSAEPAPRADALDQPNQASAPSPGLSTHGPIVAFGPAPQLPDYLREQNLNASVLIEFIVGEDGASVPHLAASSGNDELDALALTTAKKWRFNPAMQDNRPVASRARLRLNFEVK